MKKITCILIVLLISHSLAIAEEFSFQGIILGKSIKEQYPNAKIIKKDNGSTAAIVEIPADKSIGFDKYIVAILDGEAHCIYGISTPKSVTEYTLPALTAKFGKPDAKTYPMQNIAGAQFDAYRYAWKLPGDIWIELDVSTKSIDKAQLMVTTKKYRRKKP